MKIDYHIHSEFSADSKANMNELIEKAIDKEYDQIAFSEHFDLVPSEIAVYGVPSYSQFSQAINKMRIKYPNISILKGVELGEYHRCYNIVDSVLIKDPPEVKIAAIHVIPIEHKLLSEYRGTDTSSSQQLSENNLLNVQEMNISLPIKEVIDEPIIKAYYLENLKLVKHGCFDILAHLGVYKRYLQEQPDESIVQEYVEEIFELLIKNNIALEVNLSGLRKPIKSLVPDINQLILYYKMGGELITIGSDTHHINDLDQDYDKARQILRHIGFRYLFRKIKNGWEKHPS